MSPLYQVLGISAVRRHTIGTLFSRPEYRVDVSSIPSWIVDSGNQLALKVADHLQTSPNPAGYGPAHLLRTAAYAFLLGGKYYGMGKNRAALLLAGLVHDIEKDHPREVAESPTTVRPWLDDLRSRYFQVGHITDDVLDLVALHDVYKAAIESGEREGAETRRLGGRGYPKMEQAGKIFSQLPRQRRERFSYENHDVKDADNERARFLRLMERLTTADIFDRTDVDRWVVAAYQILQKSVADQPYEQRDMKTGRDKRILSGLGNKKWFDVRDQELALFDRVVEGVVGDLTLAVDNADVEAHYQSALERTQEMDESVLQLIRKGDAVQVALREIINSG